MSWYRRYRAEVRAIGLSAFWRKEQDVPKYVAIGSQTQANALGQTAKMREVWKKLLAGADPVGQ